MEGKKERKMMGGSVSLHLLPHPWLSAHPANYGPILAYSDSSPQGAYSLGLLLKAQEYVEVRWL